MHGVGLLMASEIKPAIGSFNEKTKSRYKGRKRQYLDFNYAIPSSNLIEKAQAQSLKEKS